MLFMLLGMGVGVMQCEQRQGPFKQVNTLRPRDQITSALSFACLGNIRRLHKSLGCNMLERSWNASELCLVL